MGVADDVVFYTWGMWAPESTKPYKTQVRMIRPLFISTRKHQGVEGCWITTRWGLPKSCKSGKVVIFFFVIKGPFINLHNPLGFPVFWQDPNYDCLGRYNLGRLWDYGKVVGIGSREFSASQTVEFRTLPIKEWTGICWVPSLKLTPENRPLEKEIPIGNHHF